MSVPAISGRSMILQIGSSTSAFITLPGQRTTTFTINGSSVDVTSKDDTSTVRDYNGALVRKLLDQAAPVSLTIDATGIFTDSSAFHVLDAAAMADQSIYCTLTLPGTSARASDKYIGKFKATSVQHTGAYNNAQQYTVKLESSDIVTASK